jgi:hypothetical protein
MSREEHRDRMRRRLDEMERHLRENPLEPLEGDDPTLVVLLGLVSTNQEAMIEAQRLILELDESVEHLEERVARLETRGNGQPGG